MLDRYRPPQADFASLGLLLYSTNISSASGGLSRRDKVLVENKLDKS
jgi:hypothetical protein